MKDFYDILGVKKDAAPITIKKAYRALSKIYHTDNGSAPDKDKMAEINEAYGVLSDPEKRILYDNGEYTSGIDEDEGHVILMLSQLFEKVIELDPDDIIGYLNDRLTVLMLGSRTQIEVLYESIRKLERIGKRIIRSDIMLALVEGHISANRLQISQQERIIKHAKEAKDRINGMEFAAKNDPSKGNRKNSQSTYLEDTIKKQLGILG